MNRENHYNSYHHVVNREEGLYWPEGQVIPTFALPAEQLDTISIGVYDLHEQIAVTALQGLVNKKKPRLFLTAVNPDEGADTWRSTPVVNLTCIDYSETQKYELIQKYQGEVTGIVLYDDSQNIHFRNLASTVAGIYDLLPLDRATYQTFQAQGIALEIVKDLTSLRFDNHLELYHYLFDTYWPACQHRLLFSHDPENTEFIRDLAAATGGAVVYLDNRLTEERVVYSRFLNEMPAGNSAVMGWFTEERSGITAATEYGLSTIPANFYSSGSVFAGTDHVIKMRPVPKMPALKNKIYIAVIVSDGDNIQYVQRAMRSIWDRYSEDRGQVPISWTFAPGLVDAGPAIMNYFYTTATENDFFICGPSGMGYSMPFNTFDGDGGPLDTPIGSYIDNMSLFGEYVRLTDRYLQRSGIRIVTIWDDLTEEQRETYTKYARYCSGITVQDFAGRVGVTSSVNNHVPVNRLDHAYFGADPDYLVREWQEYIGDWDGSGPKFIASQMSVWGEMKPDNINIAARKMKERYGDQVEFISAEHYFSLFCAANQIPYNLCLSSELSVTASSNQEGISQILDGNLASLWKAGNSGEQSVTCCLGGVYEITRYVLRHAGFAGMDSSLNTSDYRIETSIDGDQWIITDTYLGNEADATDIDLEPVKASFFRIVITEPGVDGTARISGLDIYGKKVHG